VLLAPGRALQPRDQRRLPLHQPLQHRYAQLLGGAPAVDRSPATEPAAAEPAPGADRLTRLEEEVGLLRAEVAELRRELQDLRARVG
jgi:hypothetical protein